jgi:hypothetical protein
MYLLKEAKARTGPAFCNSESKTDLFTKLPGGGACRLAAVGGLGAVSRRDSCVKAAGCLRPPAAGDQSSRTRRTRRKKREHTTGRYRRRGVSETPIWKPSVQQRLDTSQMQTAAL